MSANRYSSRLLPYGFALLCGAVAIGLRLLVDHWTGPTLFFSPLYGAVALSVWFGGWRPALLATLSMYLAAVYFLIPIPDAANSFVVLFPVYLSTCGIIIILGEGVRRANARLRAETAERLRAQETLHETQTLVAAGEMAATLAHEINNPLAAITNLAYLFRIHPDLPPGLQEYVRTLESESARLCHIVRQTLGIYQVQSQVPESVPLTEVVDEVIETYAAKLRGMSVERRYDPGVVINGNRVELHQMISNLILNAVDATPGNGRLKIHIRDARDWGQTGSYGVRLVIADSGSGIPESVQPHILKPFYTTKQKKGTGLGLSVVQWVAARHQGSVRFRSSTRPGRSGTCFSVFLQSRIADKKLPQTQLEDIDADSATASSAAVG